MQKLKPRVERVCREQRLQYRTEENAGRIYVNLQGGAAEPPPEHGGPGGGAQKPGDDLVRLAKKFLPRILRKLARMLCGK